MFVYSCVATASVIYKLTYLFDQKYKSAQLFLSVIKHHILFMSYSGWSTNDGPLSSAMVRKSEVLGSDATGIILFVRQND